MPNTYKVKETHSKSAKIEIIITKNTKKLKFFKNIVIKNRIN